MSAWIREAQNLPIVGCYAARGEPFRSSRVCALDAQGSVADDRRGGRLHDTENAKHYRECAREMIVSAHETYDQEEQRMLLSISAIYHRVATSLEDPT